METIDSKTMTLEELGQELYKRYVYFRLLAFGIGLFKAIRRRDDDVLQ